MVGAGYYPTNNNVCRGVSPCRLLGRAVRPAGVYSVQSMYQWLTGQGVQPSTISVWWRLPGAFYPLAVTANSAIDPLR